METSSFDRATMSPAECLRDLISERLTAAAEEIFSVCQRTIEQYEEEIDRQRRLLDVFMKPHLQLYKTEPPQQHVYEEEEEEEGLTDQQLCNQKRNSSLDQDDPEPPQIKEEQEETYTNLEGEQLVLKQETETFMLAPTCQESDTSDTQTLDASPDEPQNAAEEEHVNMSVRSPVEPELNRDNQFVSHRSHVAESQDHKGGEDGESGWIRNAESRPQNRDHASKSHTNNEVNSTTSNIHSNAYTEKKCCKCDTCGKAFKYMSILHIHMRVHTGEKPYPCNTCEKRFSHVGTLKDHMRVHTGEKPYPCNICEKRFSQLYTLKKHMRVHTGEKPYQCNTCEKRFSQLGNLKEHMSVHTGEKPYSCKTCGRDYRLRYQLKNHMRTHAGKRFCHMSEMKNT